MKLGFVALSLQVSFKKLASYENNSKFQSSFPHISGNLILKAEIREVVLMLFNWSFKKLFSSQLTFTVRKKFRTVKVNQKYMVNFQTVKVNCSNNKF